LELREYYGFVQLVAVELEPFDEPLDGSFRFERQKGHAERDVSPLTRVIGKVEALAELLDDILGLFFLCAGQHIAVERGGMWCTFSINVNMYFIVLWKVSSSTANSPLDRWLIT
jgi:hypothetical protein